MGSVDRVDDFTFKVNFSGDGAAKLRDRVKDKLKEFMGDYTDDTLVEYVIVLLRNGRRKDEARNELNVFLGDDSDSFVSWLWDHLASNLDLYVPSQAPHVEGAKTILLGNQLTGADSHRLDSDSERGKSAKFAKNRHNREWKGLVRDAAEPPPLRSSEVENIQVEEKSSRKVSHGRSASPRSSRKKRSRLDERQPIKREAVSQTIDAPRRLLQFAVRDAVGTSKASTLAKEPSFKRLRSVVSTSSGDSSLPDRPRRIQSVARVTNPMATVIKAVAEAAEDVTRVKNAGSVFDRLGPGMDILESCDSQAEFRESLTEYEDYGDLNQTLEKTQLAYHQRDEYAGQPVGNITRIESETGLASDSLSDNEGYDDVNIVGHEVMDVSHTGTSTGNKGDKSRMVQYSVAKDDEMMQITRNKDHNQSTASANPSRKIVNISVNVNTWKSSHCQEPREASELDSRKSLPESEAVARKSNIRLMKENGNAVAVGNGNVKSAAADVQGMSQKTMQSSSVSFAASRPLEDADSRTIFVSNVHFAATKDSLSRHFNKFGEVLKVVIVTDAATGQPKGSAYVEFMRKEAADNALSLDGTSFMSRILKVVKRSSAHQEAAPVMTWSRNARGSPFAAARFARAPFVRGIPGAFRSRLPIKPGARSFQWKRDAQASPADVTGNNFLSPTARSLTYVRTEPKLEGNATSS